MDFSINFKFVLKFGAGLKRFILSKKDSYGLYSDGLVAGLSEGFNEFNLS